MKLSYESYLDKVYGCLLGKGVSGTIGSPFEGRKELFNYTFDPDMDLTMLPNDDFDLQILWLEVLEKKGIYFDTMDLAESFYHNCPYSPGEYGVFKKNFARGIYPPVSGAFNNKYYKEGMGCPIRSEIWACITPGNPKLAAEYAAKDGIMDHEGDSVYAEQFFASVEAAAFLESDWDKLFEIGLEYVPQHARIYRLLTDVRRWYRQEMTWQMMRELILRDYGHPDCTNLYQNVGFTLLALYYGNGNFMDTTMLALNCGFDTDCSCATAGALIGLIQGAKAIQEEYHFPDTRFVLGVNATRRSNELADLAADICRVGLTVAKEINFEVILEKNEGFTPVPANKKDHEITFHLDYNGNPVIGYGEQKMISTHLTNTTSDFVEAEVCLIIPKDWHLEQGKRIIQMHSGQTIRLDWLIKVPVSCKLLSEKNMLSFHVNYYEKSHCHTFGLNGAGVWKCYGPFWENRVKIPELPLGTPYNSYVHSEQGENWWDVIRNFHLSWFIDMNKEYLPENQLIKGLFSADSSNLQWKWVNTCEDCFSINDFFGFQGPCITYLERDIWLPKPQELWLQIGNSDPFKLWLNGELISLSDDATWWTGENKHAGPLTFNKGNNKLVWKCGRLGEKAHFSLSFSALGPACQDLLFDYGSVISSS